MITNWIYFLSIQIYVLIALPNLRLVLWSKQSLCRNLPKWLAKLISFPCWVIPEQLGEFLEEVQIRSDDDDFKWIAKPWASGGGNGIVILSNFEMKKFLKNGKNVVIQPFLSNPLLVKGKKIDLRVYVLVTSTSPLRAYIYERGLVRFAAELYDSNEKETRNRFLTNTSINKKQNLTANDLTWSFESLWNELGMDESRQTRLGMERSITLLLLSVEEKFSSLASGCPHGDGLCYHLLGFDVILSANSKEVPRIIEVNGEPSFARGDVQVVDHYDETKILVARDIAQIVFAQPTFESKVEAMELSSQINPKFLNYVIELTRESQTAGGGFRNIYPTPISAILSKFDAICERVIGDNHHRLELHRVLNDRQLRLYDNCIKRQECQGARKSQVLDIAMEQERTEI